MAALAALSAYIGSHLLLVVGAALLSALRSLSPRLRQPIAYRHQLRLGQALSLAAVLLPPVCSSPYQAFLSEQLAQHGMPLESLAVPLVESGYRNLPQPHDPRHGAGLWMFIAPTARRFGLAVDGVRDEMSGSSSPRATKTTPSTWLG